MHLPLSPLPLIAAVAARPTPRASAGRARRRSTWPPPPTKTWARKAAVSMVGYSLSTPWVAVTPHPRGGSRGASPVFAREALPLPPTCIAICSTARSQISASRRSSSTLLMPISCESGMQQQRLIGSHTATMYGSTPLKARASGPSACMHCILVLAAGCTRIHMCEVHMYHLHAGPTRWGTEAHTSPHGDECPC